MNAKTTAKTTARGIAADARRQAKQSKAQAKAAAPKATQNTPLFVVTADEGKTIKRIAARADKATKELRAEMVKLAERAVADKVPRAAVGKALAASFGVKSPAHLPESVRNAWQYVARTHGVHTKAEHYDMPVVSKGDADKPSPHGKAARMSKRGNEASGKGAGNANTNVEPSNAERLAAWSSKAKVDDIAAALAAGNRDPERLSLIAEALEEMAAEIAAAQDDAG